MKSIKTFTRGDAIIAVLILIVIISTFIGISSAKNKNIDNYKDFENELKNDAENYVAIKKIKIKNGEEKKVSLNTLKKQNLVSNDLKDKCKGYVIISSERDSYTNKYEILYYSYIKCGNKYVSSNYSEY